MKRFLPTAVFALSCMHLGGETLAQNWREVAKLTASDGTSHDHFGFAVALSGGTAIIGARDAHYPDHMEGAAYVFERVAGQWMQTDELLPDDGHDGDEFGISVDISMGQAIVGAWRADGYANETGAAYVFVRQGGRWQQTAKLAGLDSQWGDMFGASVALSGKIAVVGAPVPYPDGGAYVFERRHDQWKQVAKLAGSDVHDSQLGMCVRIAGTTIFVGSYSERAEVYDRINGQWTHTATIEPGTGLRDFSLDMSVTPTTALIGASRENGFTGAAYVYDLVDGSWTQSARLVASDRSAGDAFGRWVALSGRTALVGARTDDDRGQDSGSAYLFVRSDQGWTQVAKLTASDGAENDRFGTGVALDGSTALIGAWWDDDLGEESGSAYVFEVIHCSMHEQLMKAECVARNGGNKLKAVLSGGTPHDGFAVTLSDGSIAYGTIDDYGEGKAKFKRRPPGDTGLVTVQWGCGAEDQLDYECH